MQFIVAAGTYVPFTSLPRHTFIDFPFSPSLLQRNLTTHRLYFACRSTSLLLVQLWLIQSKQTPFSYKEICSPSKTKPAAQGTVSLTTLPPAPFPSVPFKRGCPLCGDIEGVCLHVFSPTKVTFETLHQRALQSQSRTCFSPTISVSGEQPGIFQHLNFSAKRSWGVITT